MRHAQAPREGEYTGYLGDYVREVEQLPLGKALQQSGKALVDLLRSLPVEKWDFCYQKGKWSVRQMVQHLIDSERIMAYRAMRFARQDKTPLPGFDENDYAAAAPAEKRSPASLIREFQVLRQSSLLLFRSLSAKELRQKGVANQLPVSVRALAYVIAGHGEHHRKVLEERYLGATSKP